MIAPGRGVIDQNAAAQYLDVEPRTLEAWRSRGIGPQFVRYSRRCVRYRVSDLERWVETHLVRAPIDSGGEHSAQPPSCATNAELSTVGSIEDRPETTVGHGSEMATKREEAIVALVTNPTITDAAASIGIEAETLHRWLQEPDFQAAYEKAKLDAMLD